MSQSNNIYDCLYKCIYNLDGHEAVLRNVVKQCMSNCQPAKYTAPLLWLGLYIAGASLVCMITMAIDLFNGFRMKKSWFPCKYFTLNAAISSLLAIAMKMPEDLSTFMPCGRDQLMKLSATALMSVSMANVMPSLAAMSDPELFANLMALAVFIVPLISNICIQIGTGVIYQGAARQHVIILFCIIIQFALLVSTAIACPSMKKQLEAAYNMEARSPILTSSSSDDSRVDSTEPKISAELKKQWIMAQTSSPQFVVARSVICTASGAICVLTVLVLAEAAIELYITMYAVFFFPSSDFEWSSSLIVLVQTAAVLVGSISPISRWFTVVWFKFEGSTKQRLKDLWSVEEYWTERLEELKKKSWLGLNPRYVKFNIFIRNRKVMVLNLFIKFQKLTVLSCRLLCLVSLLFLLPFIFVYKITTTLGGAEKKSIYESEWVLRLDKEPDLPESTIKKIISVVDGNFNKGTKKAVPENQVSLLKTSDGFNGINVFDRNLIEELTKISTIHGRGVSNNPNGEWAIRIVTLSTIVCAIKTTWDNEFVSMVNNILPHVIYIEKALGAKTDKNIDLGEAAINVWLDVLSYRKWRNTELPIKTNTSTLKMKLETLKTEESHLHKIKAVEWMNETVEIIIKFLDRENNIDRDQEQQLVDEMNKIEEEQQQVKMMTLMVLDILVTCLVNLGRAIAVNISKASIEQRELVVKKAAFIDGQMVEIQKFVKKRFSSIIDSPDHKEYVHASWWKVVEGCLPEDAITRTTTSLIICDHEHLIDLESKVSKDDNNEYESMLQDMLPWFD